MKKRALFLFVALFGLLTALTVTGSAAAAHTSHPLCGAVCDCEHATHSASATTWTAWNGTSSTYAGRSYYLTQDVTRETYYGFTGSGYIRFCLNGHTLSTNGESVGFVNGSSFGLILCDCGEGGEIISSDGDSNCSSSNEIAITNKGSLTIYGGTYTGDHGIYNTETGVMKVYDGTFQGVGNDAIWNFGTAYLYGGTYTSDWNSIYNDGGTLTISGGTYGEIDNSGGNISISGGTLQGQWGTLYNYGTTSITGGSVLTPTSSSYAVQNSGTLSVSGGRVDSIYNYDSSSKCYLSGTPQGASTQSGIAVTIRYPETLFASDETGTTPYTGKPVSITLSSPSSFSAGATIVSSVPDESTAALFTLAEGHDGYSLKYSGTKLVLVAPVASGTCGTNLKWSLDSEGLLTISGTGAMNTYYSTTAPWYDYRSSIKEVLISSGVTSIGDYAFYYCTALTEISIPNTVTSVGSDAFYCCKALKEVTIPSGVQSIGYEGFIHCTQLEKVTIAGSVTTIGDFAFEYCTSLASVTLNSGLTSIGRGAFRYNAISEITIPDTVTSIGDYAFDECTNHTKYIVDTNSATYSSKNGALLSKDETVLIACPDGLSGVFTVPDGVTTLKTSAFELCEKLTEIIIPSGVTTLEYGVFTSCSGLTSIDLPDTVQTIDNYVFNACTNLSAVTFNGSAPTFGPYAFSGVTATAYYPAGDDSWDSIVSANEQYGGTLTWQSYEAILASGICGDDLIWTLDFNGVLTISGTGATYDYGSNGTPPWHEGNYGSFVTKLVVEDGVTCLSNSVFSALSNLTTVNLPESLLTIGSNVFNSDHKLTAITIPAGVTSIGKRAFYLCSALTDITVAAGNQNYSSQNGVLFNADGTTLIRYPSGKTDAKYVIPEGVNQIADDAFNVVSASLSGYLKEIVLNEGLTSIGAYAFYGANITSVDLPASVTTIGNYAFQNCKSLSRVVFRGIAPTIENKSFYNVVATCWYPAEDESWTDSITTDYSGTLTWIPYAYYGSCGAGGSDDVEWLLSEDGELLIFGTGAMDTYTTAPWNLPEISIAIKHVVVEEGVTSIGAQAFADCDELSVVELPGNLELIDVFAISNCDKLSVVMFHGDAPDTISENAFDQSSATVYYPTDDATWTENMMQNYGGELTWDPAEVCGTCGTTVAWALDADGVLTISGYGYMDDYNYSIRAPWYSYRSKIKSLVVNEGITHIGAYAFDSLTNLTSVSLPSGFIAIPGYTFSRCYNLTTFTVPDGTGVIADYAFYGSTGLKEIFIPESVCDIHSSAFASCTSLKDVYYAGTKEQWAVICPMNSIPCEHTIHYAKVLGIPSVTVSNRASDGAPYITWTQADWATDYEVYYSNTENGEYSKLVAVSSSLLEWTHTDALACSTWYYKVRAMINAVAGEFSAVQSCKMDHKYTSYTSNNDATCQTDGTETAFCDYGCGTIDTRTVENSKVDHKYTGYTPNGDATCQANGTETGTCEYGCGAEDTREVVNSTVAHAYENYVSNNDATCQANGTETGVCKYGCGAEDTREIADSTVAHAYENYVSNNDATCQADGTETASCDFGCGSTDTRTVENSKVGHKYTSYVSNGDATCLNNETETAVCDFNCGSTNTRTIANSKAGHKYSNYISNGDATCQTDGTETAICDFGCGTTNTRVAAGSKCAHKYISYVSNNNATCWKNATETAHCSFNCGSVDEREIANSKTTHKFTIYRSNNDASCAKDGTKTASCDFGCGATDTKMIENSRLEHQYTDVSDTTCNSCGFVREVAHVHVWTGNWSKNETHHWHECSSDNCTITANSEKDGYGEHTYTDIADTTCECGYVRATVIVSVQPVAPEVEFAVGLTLSEITLSGGTITNAEGESISGTWSWAEPDCTLYAGTASYQTVFVPADTALPSVEVEVELTIPAADQTLSSQHASPEAICIAYAGPGLEMKDMVSSSLDVQPVFVITEDEGEAYVEGTVLYSPDAGYVTVLVQYPGVDVNGDGINEYNACSIEIHTLFTTVPMYRMYDPNSGEHVYTGSREEVTNLVAAGWKEEGVAFNFPALGAAVYRLYDGANSGDHLYTMDLDEIDRLVAQGWTVEGVAFNSADKETGVAQYRLYNPNAHLNGTRGAWHFTSNEDERNALLAAGWQDQGIGWYSTQK